MWERPNLAQALVFVRAATELLKLAQAEYAKDSAHHIIISPVYEDGVRDALRRLDDVEWFARHAGHDKQEGK